MSDQIRVLVVDDHELVRSGLVGILGTDPGITVVAEAQDGRGAIEKSLLHRPDVVVMDLEMPTLGGVAATIEILRVLPQTAIIVLTMYDDDDSVMAALRAGAGGYLLKGAARAELRTAVRSAAAGHSVFGPEATATIRGRATADPVSPFPALTPRELEVLTALTEGLRPASIGARLGVSEKTVRNNISSILNKLNAVDRADAIRMGLTAGIGQAPRKGLSG